MIAARFSNTNVSFNVVGTNPVETINRTSRIAPTINAVFGCGVDPTGEDVQFVDDKGEFVRPDVMLACFIYALEPQHVVLPINRVRKRFGTEIRGSPTGESCLVWLRDSVVTKTPSLPMA